MPTQLTLTPHESVEIRSSSAAALEVEVIYGSSGARPPKHFHPHQDEHFHVLEGKIEADVDGVRHSLAPGDELEIPRGTPHQLWNPDTKPARAIWQTSPPGRTEQWFRALDALHREGRVGKNGMPGPLAFGVMLSEYRDVLRLAGPDFLLRPALATLGALGRRRGYSPRVQPA